MEEYPNGVLWYDTDPLPLMRAVVAAAREQAARDLEEVAKAGHVGPRNKAALKLAANIVRRPVRP